VICFADYYRIVTPSTKVKAPAPMTAHVEFELKLTGPEAVLKALPKSPLLADYIHDSPTRRFLTTTYFDTPEHVLRQAQMVWRVRRQGRMFAHTIKYRPDGHSGVISKAIEIERLVKSDRPDQSLLDDPEITSRPAMAKLLGTTLSRADFGPVFVTQCRRTIYTLKPSAESEIELAIDLGEIRSGEKISPLTEAEFELKAGGIDRIYDLATAVLKAMDLRIEPETKSDRGYRLSLDLPLAVYKAPPVELPKAIAADDALYRVLKSSITQIAVNGRVFEQAHAPEAVHQMRVGLRRARAAFALFRDMTPGVETALMKSRLKAIADLLGPLRDLDVFLDEGIPRIAHALGQNGSDISLAPLVQAANQARDLARANAYQAVADKELSILLIEFDRYLETRRWRATLDAPIDLLATPIGPFAAKALDARLRRSLRAAKHLDKLLGEGRHRVRIELKKLRYGGQFFESLFARKPTRSYLERLSDLQDLLGGLNDAFMAETLITKLVAEAPAEQRAELGFAGGIAIGVNLAQATQDWAMVVRKWPDFAKAKPFWRGE